MDIGDDIIGEVMAGETVDCQKGCAWCCHQLVIVTNWEDGERILEVVRQVMTEEEFAEFDQRVREQAAAIESMGHERAEARAWTCPLLKNDECRVYEVRPVACRTVFSSDASCCQAMMQADSFEDLTPDHQALATEISERSFRLQIAINDGRAVHGPMELRSLLVRLLDQEL